jgi:hypothetical protein
LRRRVRVRGVCEIPWAICEVDERCRFLFWARWGVCEGFCERVDVE